MAIPLSKTRRIGPTLYLSGELGFRADGTLAEGIAAQTRQCLENIAATLAKEGLGLDKIVSATCYLTDPADFAAFNAVYAEMMPQPYPVRTTIGCALMIDAKVEITVIAET